MIKSQPPVIYFGPPKTSSTFFYHSFQNFENYLILGTKEWKYLYILDLFGEHTYLDRFDKFHGSNVFSSIWSNIYNSHIEHLKHFLRNPASEISELQITHSTKLNFDNHNLQNYLTLFNTNSKHFVVDFCPSNCLISQRLIKEIFSQNPQIILLVPIRPILPQMVSLIHEAFVWFCETRTNKMEISINRENVKATEIRLFKQIVNSSLQALENIFATDQKSLFSIKERVELMKSKKETSEIKESVTTEEIIYKRATKLADRLFLTLNYYEILKKIQYIDRAVYFNPVRAPLELPKLAHQLEKLGLKTGSFKNTICSKRIRESNAELIELLFQDKATLANLKKAVFAIQKYFNSRLDRNTIQYLFPECVSKYDSVTLETLRQFDYSSDSVILQKPTLS
jgi:hypothetical protein